LRELLIVEYLFAPAVDLTGIELQKNRGDLQRRHVSMGGNDSDGEMDVGDVK
jgi:hypothetical protein